MRHESAIVREGFVEAGILETLNEDDSAEAEDPLSSEDDPLSSEDDPFEDCDCSVWQWLYF